MIGGRAALALDGAQGGQRGQVGADPADRARGSQVILARGTEARRPVAG